VQPVQVTQRGGPAVLKMMPLPDSVPGEGQAVVKVEAIGVNYVDILARRGTYPRAPSPPFVPGIEVAGTVSRVGPKVSGAQGGDRIVGLAAGGGGYAE
jgi:NADPH:quinone reductase